MYNILRARKRINFLINSLQQICLFQSLFCQSWNHLFDGCFKTLLISVINDYSNLPSKQGNLN